MSSYHWELLDQDNETADLDSSYHFEPLDQDSNTRCMNSDCPNTATHLLIGPDYPGCPSCLRAWLASVHPADR
jgi:hypothetical protein